STVDQCLCEATRVTKFAPQRHALLKPGAPGLIVALIYSEVSSNEQRPRPRRRVGRRVGPCKRSLDPALPLDLLIAHVPEPEQSPGQAQLRFRDSNAGTVGCPVLVRPFERAPQIVVLLFQPIRPDDLLRAAQVRLGRLRQR